MDVSHAPEIAVGDEVIIFGEQNGHRVTADDHARWAETIPYEILCAVGARVPRHALRMTRSGRIAHTNPTGNRRQNDILIIK